MAGRNGGECGGVSVVEAVELLSEVVWGCFGVRVGEEREKVGERADGGVFFCS